MTEVIVGFIKTVSVDLSGFLGFVRGSRLLLMLLSLGFTGASLLAQSTNTPVRVFELQAASTNSSGNASTNSSGNNGNNGVAKGKNKPKVSERPQIIGDTGSSSDTTKGKPANPGNSGNGADPAEVKNLVSKFQSARDQYISAQKELRLKMKDATEEQRSVLRDQLKDLLDKWKEEQKQFVEETKERAKSMKQELQPDLGKVVDGAGNEGSGGRGR